MGSGVNLATQYGICSAAVAVYVLREIWVSRFHSTFEGSTMTARGICLKVIRHTQLLNLVTSPKKPSSDLHPFILDILGIKRTPLRIKRGLWCKWERSSLGWFRLNIDGSAREGNITGCGVLQNADGYLIAAFSSHYGHVSNSVADFLALLEGLNLRKTSAINSIIIESDSTLIVNSLKSGMVYHWQLQYLLHDVAADSRRVLL